MSSTPDELLGGILDRWRCAFDERRTADLAALYTEDAVFQGISPRLMVGRDEIFGYYRAVADGARAVVELLRADQLGEGILGGFADVTFTHLTGDAFAVRLSVVARRVDASWLIQHYHAAAH